MDNLLRKCSHCGGEKCTTEYYSKGNRLDSRCKTCVLELKKQKAKTKKKALMNKSQSKTLITPVSFNLKVASMPVTALELWIESIEVI